jgi:hypothetical protein
MNDTIPATAAVTPMLRGSVGSIVVGHDGSKDSRYYAQKVNASTSQTKLGVDIVVVRSVADDAAPMAPVQQGLCLFVR